MKKIHITLTFLLGLLLVQGPLAQLSSNELFGYSKS